MRSDLPTGTVTFLFTDVEASTRLLRALGPAAYAAALGQHRRAVRTALTQHGGVEVDTQGDVSVSTCTGAPGSPPSRTAGRSSSHRRLRRSCTAHSSSTSVTTG